MLKKTIIGGLLILTLIFGATTAQAWYVELTNVDGTLTSGEWYSMDIYFQGDDSADILNDIFVNVQYDTTKLTYNSIVFNSWYDMSTLEQVWGDFGAVGHDPSTGFIDTIAGSETFSNPGLYNPMGEESSEGVPPTGTPVSPANQIATIWFQAIVDGDYTNLATFAFDPIFITQVTMDNTDIFTDVQLAIVKSGTSSTLNPVPIPSTVVLLTTGLLGVFGIRRKKS